MFFNSHFLLFLIFYLHFVMKTEFEKITPDAGSSFTLLHIDIPVASVPWHYHYHPEIELVNVVRGSGKRHVGNHISYFDSGDLVLIGSNLPHAGFGNGAIGEHEEIVIQFKAEFIENSLKNWPEFTEINNLFEKASQGIHFFGETEIQVKKLLSKMLEVKQFERLLLLFEVFQILAKSTEYELLNKNGIRYNFQKKDELRLKNILDFVEKNYQKNIEFKHVAELANMTIPAFSAYFKKTMSITFTDFLNEFRVNQACNLLLAGKSVTDAGFESGFNNVTYFIKVFKTIKGDSPLVYQKKSII
jgi:AraC-like DNA-binding protein/mannose-6-phosphate isomerase-like protein (cupin superfamily)